MTRYHSRWLSSTDPENADLLITLEQRLAEFYAHPKNYYSEIDFCSSSWQTDPTMIHLADLAKRSSSILELGCGRAHILDHHPEIAPRYSGLDFSKELISANRNRFPDANFLAFGTAEYEKNKNCSFDLIFSTFVIEHVVFPHQFLQSSVNQLNPGGHLAVRCPDFFQRGLIPSLRTGRSYDTLHARLSSFRLLDLSLGLIDRFLVTPATCRRLRQRNDPKPPFWINADPACLHNTTYRPDYDAVYWTWDLEIIRALESLGCTLVDTGHPTSDGQEIYIVVKKQSI